MRRSKWEDCADEPHIRCTFNYSLHFNTSRHAYLYLQNSSTHIQLGFLFKRIRLLVHCPKLLLHRLSMHILVGNSHLTPHNTAVVYLVDVLESHLPGSASLYLQVTKAGSCLWKGLQGVLKAVWPDVCTCQGAPGATPFVVRGYQQLNGVLYYLLQCGAQAGNMAQQVPLRVQIKDT